LHKTETKKKIKNILISNKIVDDLCSMVTLLIFTFEKKKYCPFMKYINKIIFSLLLIALAAPTFAQKKKNETWLWEISGNGLDKPSYLFGTIHILCPSDFSISDKLKEMITETQQLVLEVVDADNPANAPLVMQSMAMKGKTLKSLYTDDEYKEIDAFFTDSIGVSIVMFNSFMPMLAMISILPKMLGCVQPKSFETELTAIVRKQGKQVKEVETLAQQLHFFDTIPYEIQAKELLRTVREWNKEKATLKALVEIYKQQQFSKSQAFIRANMGSMVEYKDVFLDHRNKAWISKRETHFVCFWGRAFGRG